MRSLRATKCEYHLKNQSKTKKFIQKAAAPGKRRRRGAARRIGTGDTVCQADQGGGVETSSKWAKLKTGFV